MSRTILSADHVRKALSDPKFFDMMPEFSALKSKLDTMKKAPTKYGCSSCREKRLRSSLHSDFVTTLNSLPTSALQRFKKYLGSDELLINAYDTKSGKTVLKRY